MNIPKIFIFNFFTKQSFEKHQMFNFFGKRLNSSLLDFSFMIGLFFPLFLLWFVSFFFTILSTNEVNAYTPLGIGFIPFLISTLVLINKDFYNAKSIGKREYGYQIVDVKTNSPASEFKCALRNLTLMIWPLEVLAIMSNPKKRIGDYIAGTKIIDSNRENPELIMNEIQEKKNIENRSQLILISVIICFLFGAISLIPQFLSTTFV